jgi:hypothetical protein
MLLQLEDELMTWLGSDPALSGVQILNAPKERQSVRNRAELLLFYSGSDLASPQGNVTGTSDRSFRVRQVETLRWSATLRLINLQNHQDAYPFIEGLRNRISGYRPKVAGNFRFFVVNSINFVSINDGADYVYQVDFSIELHPS